VHELRTVSSIKYDFVICIDDNGVGESFIFVDLFWRQIRFFEAVQGCDTERRLKNTVFVRKPHVYNCVL
jgi:hypothetical protein